MQTNFASAHTRLIAAAIIIDVVVDVVDVVVPISHSM
jgi:hypothetical protein